MSNFTPLVTKTYTFEGDAVEVTFARLKRKHMLQIMPYITKSKNKEDQTEAVTTLLNIVLDVLPEYVKSMTGLKGQDGEDVSVATLCDEVYFMGLATDIVLDLVNESVVMDGKKGKNG